MQNQRVMEVRPVSQLSENESLELLTPVPDELLQTWLGEFYGKPITISDRQVLRHRDLSYVERLKIADALPESIIYKQVLPPWDIEQDLHERVLQPSITSSAQLFLSGHYGQVTAMFMEEFGYKMLEHLSAWKLCTADERKGIIALVQTLAKHLAGEPTSLVHGDMYAENIILRNNRLFFIDWSWFTMLGAPLMDLATLASDHYKNGELIPFRDVVIDAYCYEFVRDAEECRRLLPFAETLSRLLFLQWLVERRHRGILGTTVGPVDNLIPQVIAELIERLQNLTV